MGEQAKAVADAMDDLAKAVRGATSNNALLTDTLGWNAPPLSKGEIALMAETLASRLRKIKDGAIHADWEAADDIKKINFVKDNVVPNLFNSNGVLAFSAYQNLIVYLESSFDEFFVQPVDWEAVDEEELVPKRLAMRVRALRSRVDTIYVGSDKLAERVDAINNAFDAATAFPTEIDALAEDRSRIAALKLEADEGAAAIRKAQEEAIEAAKQAAISAAEAAKLVENTADAYRAATTKGLSESFQVRADKTANSMWTWVVGLMLSLGIGAYLGKSRLDLVQSLMTSNASSGMITINLFLAAFSIAAPVWFAWIATKQIGHRFRLSEDYAFKASVAKAYEGYRREAARIDDSFAARLFSSALDRLEEAPLRFVESETFGSPWHEVMELKARREAKKAQTAADRAAAAAATVEATSDSEE